MKKFFSIIAVSIILMSCGSSGRNDVAESDMVTNGHIRTSGVEVIYFHGRQRCVTCMAIEKVASETVAERYAGENVRFKVVDIDAPEGEPLAERYRIARSSLLVVNHGNDGSETVENMTGKAFANARLNPDGFSDMLCDVINPMLQ